VVENKNAKPDFRAGTIERSETLFELSGIQPKMRDHHVHIQVASSIAPP
jgi:hypothetical protein